MHSLKVLSPAKLNLVLDILGKRPDGFHELKTTELAGYASGLGSDVAFFLYNTSYGLGTGRGEHIQPLNLRTKLWHVLVTPRVKMYTRDVFARLKLNLINKKDSVNILLPFL